MKRFNKNVKGVTLVSLSITIIVLIILTSVGIYSATEVIKSSKFTKFTTEMKIVQTHVNQLYEQYRNGDNNVLNLGKEINTVQLQADKVFSSSASGITEQTGYRYFDQETIKGLNIEGLEEDFFINVEKRSVVSFEGIEYEGVTYYTLEQLPNGLYNVKYEDKNTAIPTFDVEAEEIGDNKWKINISNIQYSGYINKWKVNYKLEGQDYWNTSKDYNFIVKGSGKYTIQLVNGTITSQEKELKVEEIINTSSLLPSEYQQVEYIESTGTQYIDTGFIADSNTSIEMKVFNKSTATACLYCARTGIKEKTFSAFLINGNVLRVDYGNLQYTNLMTISSDTVYTYKHDKNLVYVNEQLIETKTLTESEFNTGYNMYLLASHTAGASLSNRAKLELYYCKIWDNGVLVRDFTPCYKKDTGKIGLYDIVNDVFYTNQGTGTEDFEKGADVN